MRLVQQSLGAQVLGASWDSTVAPLFYLSPMAMGDLPRRGGVPILFPQFADRGPLPKHGFARNLSWQCLAQRQDDRLSQSHYQLAISPNLLLEWPHAASLDLWVQMSPSELIVRLRICNSGQSAFAWTGGLHPYWYVDDLQEVQIVGLQHLPCEDRYLPHLKVESSPQLTLARAAFERLYLGAPSLEFITKKRTIRLSCEGFCEWMIWNPGEQGASELADLPAGDWRRFVCIEPVIASKPHYLLPGECFEGSLRVAI